MGLSNSETEHIPSTDAAGSVVDWALILDSGSVLVIALCLITLLTPMFILKR